MSLHNPNDINQLVGQLLYLQEEWEESPDKFDWTPLEALAAAGATAYNEGNGPSFQILAVDGMHHDQFHLHFLEYSLAAGFDPFKLVQASWGRALAPVWGHEAMADAARSNPWSAKMQARLHEVARARFGSARDVAEMDLSAATLAATIEACRDSLPPDVLDTLAGALRAAQTAVAA